MSSSETKMLSPTHGMLTAIWERGLPRLRERLLELDAVASAAMVGSLTAERRELAANTAHQLAGSLGMFGYTQGTETARAIEVMLEADGALDAAKLAKLSTTLRGSLNL
jgi:HPt (histidine-containing phosphotransfer) domain-containing protein